MKKSIVTFTLALLLSTGLTSSIAQAAPPGGGQPIVIVADNGGNQVDPPTSKSWQRIFPTRTH